MHDYLLANQDRVTGDYNAFWAARDYLGKVDRIRASVFVVHGLNDFNVRTKAFAEWWYRLAKAGVERKIWLHNGGHGGPGGAGATAYQRAQNRWFDHYLFGVDNGVESEPRATVQREDGSYTQEARLARSGHEHRDARARLRLAHRAGHAVGQAQERRPAAVHRPRPRARHRRRADPVARHGEPESARLPHARPYRATCA